MQVLSAQLTQMHELLDEAHSLEHPPHYAYAHYCQHQNDEQHPRPTQPISATDAPHRAIHLRVRPMCAARGDFAVFAQIKTHGRYASGMTRGEKKCKVSGKESRGDVRRGEIRFR